MSRRNPKPLTDEDRVLWNRVAVTTKPLPGRILPEIEAAFLEFDAGSSPQPSKTGETARLAPPAAKPQIPRQSRPQQIDAPTRAKLGRERVPIDGSVDLHGLTQSAAHSLLLSFLRSASGRGMRHVLVVTGKGSSPGSEGVLRRAVPEWLSTPPFSTLVSGHGGASRRHGGAGAIYIRLKRQHAART